MKKLHSSLLFLFCFSLFALHFTLSVDSVFAQSPSPQPTDDDKAESFNKRINNLKDRIASKVAELDLVEKRGVIGIVTDITQTKITLSGEDDANVFIDVDELTKFASPSAKENFGISDIKKNTTLGVLGIYNKESRRILARFVDVMVPYVTLYGKITDVDEENFAVTLTSEEKKETIIDIETTTKSIAYTKTGGEKRAGFSQLSIGTNLLVFGYQNLNTTTRMSASRIVVLPDLANSPTANITSKASPSAKLLPTKKLPVPTN